jgi:uncharacterized protein
MESSATWRDRLGDMVSGFIHPAWGHSHARRVLEMALSLASEEEMYVDEDSLLAAAYLHDVGAFEPYKRDEVDHAVRSAEVAPFLLEQVGFDPNRFDLVSDIIVGHMFYSEPTSRPEAVVFHDADALDFAGAIGALRLIAAVGLDDWTPDTKSAIELVRRLRREIPDTLVTESAKRVFEQRRVETEEFLRYISHATDGFRLL